MYAVTHNNPYRFGYWLPCQHFMELDSALKYAESIGECSVYDYNLKKTYIF